MLYNSFIRIVQGDKYIPLSDVKASSGLFNVTGVVTSIRTPEKSRGGGEYFSKAISRFYPIETLLTLPLRSVLLSYTRRPF
jgi:hypothetical protein